MFSVWETERETFLNACLQIQLKRTENALHVSNILALISQSCLEEPWWLSSSNVSVNSRPQRHYGKTNLKFLSGLVFNTWIQKCWRSTLTLWALYRLNRNPSSLLLGYNWKSWLCNEGLAQNVIFENDVYWFGTAMLSEKRSFNEIQSTVDSSLIQSIQHSSCSELCTNQF